MKLRNFFIAAVVGLFGLAACEGVEQDLGVAKISIDPLELPFPKEESSLQVTIIATRDWNVSVNTLPEWIALSATEGKASAKEQTITVTVEENLGNDREAAIVITAGMVRATLTVKQAGEKGEIQKGSGTLEDPYSVAGVISYVEELGADVKSDDEVYVKGVVTSIEEAYSSQFGNATFYIKDDQSSDKQFYVFRIKFLGNEKWALGNTQIAVGDEVIIHSRVVNYKGNTPETVMIGATAEGGPYAGYLYSLNGKTEDEKQEFDYSKAESKTVAEFIEAADKSTFFKLTGEVGGSINTQYGNFDLTDETGTIYVYGTTNIAEYASKLKAGAKVTLAATYDYYATTQKHEAVNAYILSIEEGEAPDYSNAPAKTVADFIAAADKNTYYKLTGEVGGSINTQYGNFDLTDETGTIYVYGTDNISEYASKLKAGTKVTLAAKYDYYASQQKHEAVHAYILSIEEGETPDYNNAPAKTVADFIAAADKNTYYKLTGEVGGSINTQYGNFDLTDETGTIYVYGTDNISDYASNLKAGAKVTLAAKYDYYEKNQKHEAVHAYILSIEGGSDQPGPGGETTTATPSGDGTQASPYNVAAAIDAVKDLTWTSNTEYDKVGPFYVKGKVKTVKEAFGAEFGNGTFELVDEGYTTVFTAYRILYFGNVKWAEGDASVAEGDEIVVYASLMNYRGNTPETVQGDGYLYSLNGQTSIEQSDVFGVEKTEINVSASATGATVKVKGNVAWTATSTATIDKASGEGAGEIAVSFPANEDTENAKTYTVTISTDADVQTKSYTVTITQAKAIVAGQTTDIEFVISEIATANSWVNGTKYATIEKDGVTLTATGGSNTGKYYTSGNEWRFYQSENPNLTITVEGGHQFVSSTLTYNVNNNGILVGSDGQTVASGSTSTCTSYTVANSGSATNGQVKFTKIVVTIQ